MPRTSSAKKALRQNARRKSHNMENKRKMKEVMKNFKKLLSSGKKDEAKKALIAVYKTVDKIAKTGYIKREKANRIKSRLSKKLK